MPSDPRSSDESLPHDASQPPSDPTRRRFVQAAAATGALGPTAIASAARRSRGLSGLRLGLVGCGGRGTGAAVNALEASGDATVVAIGDAFADRMNGCRGSLASRHPERATVPDERCFVGFDAFERVIAQDIDLVILATPPQFRPAMFAAAVEAGKHVFMEKPVAVDPTGIRTVVAAAQQARAKRLSVVAGTQRRHERSYLATIEQIRNGVIGDVTGGACYWNQGGLWMKPREAGWTDMEWQLRNWLYFTWLSGDHIVEQHVHNIDVCNWVIGTHPIRAIGLGGREVRTDAAYGHVYDHFAVEFEYPDDVRVTSLCRQQDGTTPRVEEFIRGTRGACRMSPGRGEINGQHEWWFEGANPNPYVQEHRNLHESIRTNAGLNEGEQVAMSTMTAIFGRLACYTGRELEWDDTYNLDLTLAPSTIALGPVSVPEIAVPGRTRY